MELLGTLLAVHAIYFQRQRCRDRFEGALGIEALREAEHAAGGAAAPQPAPGMLLQSFPRDACHSAGQWQ